MKTLNIYRKAQRGKARLVKTVEVEGTFDAAVAAVDAYRATLLPTTDKIFWNWSDSAWRRGK